MSEKSFKDPGPASHVTSRDCERILGGVIEGLAAIAGVDNVRIALHWWSANASRLLADRARWPTDLRD